MKRSILLLLGAVGLLVVPMPAPPRAAALPTDPVVSVTVSPAAPVGGDVVTFHTCVSLPGFELGAAKIVKTNTRTFATINWANSSVLPRTFVDPCFDYTYQTRASEASATSRYTFSVCTPVSSAYNPRLVCGAGVYFVAAPVVTFP